MEVEREESVASNSPQPILPHHHFTDRLLRALTHRLFLLHRSGPAFSVLGATANVYTVTLSAAPPSCTCPDRSSSPCKHILFVLLRVLRLPLDDPCLLLRRPLRPCHLANPTAPDVMAGVRVRERFHEIFSNGGGGGERRRRRGEEEGAATCPVCLEEMGGGGEGEVVATCGSCGNSLHGECLRGWKRSRGRRAATCVVCRARWRERREVERYVNLAAFVEEEEGGLCAR